MDAAVLHNVDRACVAAGHDDRALADGDGLGVADVWDLAFRADVQPMCAVSDALDLGRADVGVDPLQDRGAGGPDVGAGGGACRPWDWSDHIVQPGAGAPL